ncbi:polyketide synthase dehydratase domain-containing protein, partial [Kitasatospora sp. NPDC097643]|uniref:polyketide synthase dehydratase domain-containing protein n=1 Tax=Kitasatospora sp. NPDC097643 TaxID=3157230 RepID=UPI00331E55BC
MAQPCLAEDTDAVLTPALRRDRSEPLSITTALAQLHVRGAKPDWQTVFAGTGARRVDLPTYPFQREAYWIDRTAPVVGDARAIGLGSADHPLLGAAVALADSDGFFFSGRLSVQTHPWLAEHAVGGSILLPGTAFVELAIRAGDHVGCDRLDELTLEAPLVLPERGGVQVQLWVGQADGTGARPLSVYSRPEDADDDAVWTRHADGLLSSGARPAADADFAAACWPPADSAPVDLTGFYDALAASDFGYGPVFRGLVAAWVRGEEVFAEVALPEEAVAAAGAFGLHPALLDAALHATALATAADAEQGRGRLPFSWNGVSLHAVGAATLRVRIAPAGPESVTLTAVDATGAPVASVASLMLRPVSAGQLHGDGAHRAQHDALFSVDWAEVHLPARAADAAELHTVVGADGLGLAAALLAAGHAVDTPQSLTALVARLEADRATPAPATVLLPLGIVGAQLSAGAVRVAVREALALVQEWLAADVFVDSR